MEKIKIKVQIMLDRFKISTKSWKLMTSFMRGKVVKIGSFIYLPYSKLKSKLILLHDKLTNTDINDVETTIVSPYQMFFSWLLEIIQYGSLITLVYFVLLNQVTILYIPTIGIGRWLILDSINEIKKVWK